MTYLTAIHHLETVATTATKVWSLGSELFSITALLWCLNAVATMIEKTYKAGYVVGQFYWRHLHKPLRTLVIRFVALVILTMQLAWEGAVWCWCHRQSFVTTINAWRQTIAGLFVYPMHR